VDPEGLPIQMDPSSMPSDSFHGAHLDSTTTALPHAPICRRPLLLPCPEKNGRRYLEKIGISADVPYSCVLYSFLMPRWEEGVLPLPPDTSASWQEHGHAAGGAMEPLASVHGNRRRDTRTRAWES